MSDAQLKAMVDRFLGWKLPASFSPDAGIGFRPYHPDQKPESALWPSGTNLLTATEARAMLEHVVMPVLASPSAGERPGAQAPSTAAPCPDCKGTGADDPSDPESIPCGVCSGTGLAAPSTGGAETAESDVEAAPPNSLPDWDECRRVIENAEFRRRAKAGLEGPVLDLPPTSPEPTELHRFIYEYDDASRIGSGWFMHRLERLVNELRASSAPAQAVETAGVREALTDLVSELNQFASFPKALMPALRNARAALQSPAASPASKEDGAQPVSAPSYYCNKCGYVGPVQTGHQRPYGIGECGYMATGPIAPSAGQTLPAETPVQARLGTGSGAGAQSDSGADSGHFARAVQSEGSTGEAPGAAMTDLPRHRFWGAGEPDCPPDIKAPNGELCTMRCKVCGDGWRKSHNICFAALATVEAKEKTR